MSSSPSDDLFATTRWTMVVSAGESGGAALEDLCSTYWFPVYAYIRRRASTKEDAEDLTQGFFASLLARNDIAALHRDNGKFRAFLLAAAKHFLANQHDKRGRLKRGGGAQHLSLDWQRADALFRIADHAATPDAAYDREWATALLERVIAILAGQMAAEGQARRFEVLRNYLSIDAEQIPHARAAADLGIDESAARVAVHRMRKRYRSLLREEIGRTLADPGQVDDEMGVLMAAFG